MTGIIEVHKSDAGVLAASDDEHAVAAWLAARGQRSTHTRESYQRESRRLLIWLRARRLTLRTMTVEDVHSFYEHLASPPTHWIRPRKPAANALLLDTQLLAGPLSPKSINYARTVLGQMMSYLQDAGYVQRNAFRLSAVQPETRSTMATRHLDVATWQWLWRWITELPACSQEEQRLASRVRWLFALLYHSGLRVSEVAAARMSDFVRTEQGWRLRVIGKGRKEGFVTVNSVLLEELVRHRQMHGLPPLPVPQEREPLVPPVRGDRLRLLTTRSISNIVRAVSTEAASLCGDPHIRNGIERMSTHWMRHTSATHRLAAGARLETTQDEYRHSNINTTRLYAAVLDEARREHAEKLAELARGPRKGAGDGVEPPAIP